MKRHQRGTLLSSLPAGLSGAIAGGCTPEREYDIVIYGGGSSGFIAAVQGAKLGKSVALVEPGNRLGGINVEGLGGTDINNHNEFQNSPKFSFKGAQNLRNWEDRLFINCPKRNPLYMPNCK